MELKPTTMVEIKNKIVEYKQKNLKKFISAINNKILIQLSKTIFKYKIKKL